MAGKQYGLILPKSKGGVGAPAGRGRGAKAGVASAFGEDDSSSSGEEMSTDWMKKKLESANQAKKQPLKMTSESADAEAARHAASFSGGLKRGAQTKMAAAIKEDPTVYQYDEVYDDMTDRKAEVKAAQSVEKADRKPKYIQNLLKQAEVRERERERRVERKVQKEREAEGDEFKDKEAFVTSAYRKKMEEMEKAEEEEAKKEEIEKILDVRKQKDMSGFYRHLYRQTWGEEKGQVEAKEAEKDTKLSAETEQPTESGKPTFEKKAISKNREIRQRRDSADESSSDSSSDSDSDSSSDTKVTKDNQVQIDDKAEQEKTRREDLKKQREKRERRKRRIEAGEDSSSEDEADTENGDQKPEGQSEPTSLVGGDETTKENQQPKFKKPKVDIWQKVTVGQKFEDALERYFQRKSSRPNKWPIER